MTEMYLLYPRIVALTYNLHNPSPVQTLEQCTNIRRRMIRVNQNLQGKKKRKEPHMTLLMQTCPKPRKKHEKDSNSCETNAQIKASKIPQRRKRLYRTDRHVFDRHRTEI